MGVIGSLIGPIFSIHDLAALKNEVRNSVNDLKYPVNFYYREGNEYLVYFGVSSETQLLDIVINEISSCLSYTCYTGKATDPNEKNAEGKPKFDPVKYALDQQIDGPWHEYAGRKSRDEGGSANAKPSEDGWVDVPLDANDVQIEKPQGGWRATIHQAISTKFSRWGDLSYIKNPITMGIAHLLWFLPFVLWRLGTIWVCWILKKDDVG